MQEKSVNDTASRVDAIIERIGRQPCMLVPVLQAAQEEFKYLPREVMTLVADGLGVPPARVYGVATFYAHFALEPKGKYVIRCCDGTACHVKGSLAIIDGVRAFLNLVDPKEKTTSDGMYTFESVSCLGACGLAPVLLIADKVHGQATAQSTIQFIKDMVARDEEGGSNDDI
ncbi:MAG: NAD(P)H-dependent oxidoreductase subunit E [Proteobacteria bacterium]|nr:NAD(P)H-dependent oxidoreductase subunit E [Pseudomonadota bacterium]